MQFVVQVRNNKRSKYQGIFEVSAMIQMKKMMSRARRPVIWNLMGKQIANTLATYVYYYVR